MQWNVSEDFFIKSIPMQMPEEVQVLNKQAIGKYPLTKISYSTQGTKVAMASQDYLITVIRTPIFQNNLEMTTLQGHNNSINSLHWSSSDQYLLSSSADKRCILWNLNWQKKGEKLIYLDRQLKTKPG